MPVNSIVASAPASEYHTTQRGFSCSKVTTTLAATAGVGLLILTNLPTAEAAGGPGTVGFPLCLAGCVALVTGMSAGWGAVGAWMACKAACIAAAVAF